MRMKHIVSSIAFALLIGCTTEQEWKMSANQVKTAAFIKKYQDSIVAAPDSATKLTIFTNMWTKRVKYIQDPFIIPTIPTDTFIFEKAIVRDSINPKDDKEYLEIMLDNGNYAAQIIHTGIKNSYLQESAIYRMAKHLKENVPVKVIGNVMGMSLCYPNIEWGTKKIMLDIRADSIFNLY